MRYVIRRLLQSLIVVFGVSVVAFGMLFMTGDPTEVILGQAADQMSVTQIEEFRVKMGFDRPWYVQYASFVGKALQGDFGYSFVRHQPAYEVITDKLPATIELASCAFALSLADFDPARRPVRDRGRTAARSYRHGARIDRPIDPELLARHPADPLVRRPPQMVAHLRQRHLAAYRHAGDCALRHSPSHATCG